MRRSPFALNMLYFALASVETAAPTLPYSSTSKDAAAAIVCGKTVASPLRATPCSASFHQWYAGTPSLSTPGASIINSRRRSSGVILSMMAAAWREASARRAGPISADAHSTAAEAHRNAVVFTGFIRTSPSM